MARLSRLVSVIVSCVYAAAAPPECTYACPTAIADGRVLVTHPHAIPYTGAYSIFDCVYGVPRTKFDPFECSYYKESGLLALSAAGSLCPEQALSCAVLDAGKARYSAPEKVETPPWIENTNNLLWVQGHL